MNFGRNTYKGNLQQEALIKALNAEYGGGYKVAYVYMNMNGGKMNTGRGVGLKTDSDIKKDDKEYITSGKYKSYLENNLEYLKKENVSKMYDWERKRHLDKIDDIEKIIDDLTHRPSKVRTVKYAEGGKMQTGGGVDAMSTVNKISRISGLRTVAIREWGDKNNINLATVLQDLKAKKITGMDLVTAIIKPGEKYSKEFISKYSKMSMGGNTRGWKHKHMA